LTGRRFARVLLAGVAAALGLAIWPIKRAEAYFVLTMQDQPSESRVVVTGSGSLDLSSLTFQGTEAGAGDGESINPSNGTVSRGGELNLDFYTGLTGPSSFGSGGTTFAAGLDGDPLYVSTGDSQLGVLLGVPAGYVSGAQLSDDMTFVNASFASLGVTPGIYFWNWGSDFVQLDISGGLGSPVPEPASLTLLTVGFAGLLGLARHQRTAA
jgi:hypothetical protein